MMKNMMSKSLIRQSPSENDDFDVGLDDDNDNEDKLLGLIKWVGKHWLRLIALVVIVTIIVVGAIGYSAPTRGRVFEGKIIRIDPERIVVHVINDKTVAKFNSTIGICYDEGYRSVCRIGDQVELTEFNSWYDDQWVITALVD